MRISFVIYMRGICEENSAVMRSLGKSYDQRSLGQSVCLGGRHSSREVHLKNLKEVEGIQQYLVEVSNELSALEDLHAEVQCNSAWETIGL
jgi:hypothetical protein